MRSSLLHDGDVTGVPRLGTEWVVDALAGALASAWICDDESGALEWAGDPAALLDGVPGSLTALEALVHDDDRDARRVAIARAVQRGEPWVCLFRLARHGEQRWLEERGRGRAGPGGRAQAAALLVDVTRRRETEAVLELRLRREARERHEAQLATETAEAALRALARSEAYLESIFASMTDGLVLCAPDGRITRMNPTAQQMLGFGAAEVRMTPAERMARLRLLDADGKVVPLERLPVVAALRGEAVRGEAYCLDLADGRKVWAVCGAAPIRAPDGLVMGAVLTLGDVTRMREVQEQREDLSRMISHDLRTPLGVILAQAKLIGRCSEAGEAIRTRAEAIATSAQRMTAMLNDLVESTLLESGKLRLERQPVDLAAMARDLRGRLADSYDGDRIRIDAAADVPAVSADPARLERVLVNLLTNALKYSDSGSAVVVRVSAQEREALLEVEDHGPGIKGEDLPHLFERYFRSLSHHHYEGMGLGLYTARCLVEAHGGTIGVTSTLGQGSVFRVRLPR